MRRCSCQFDAGELTSALIELRERVHADPVLPDVRIGAAFGAATPRAGDWFGTTVNVASRVAELAAPGQILAAEEFVAQTGEVDWKKRRKRSQGSRPKVAPLLLRASASATTP